MSNILEYKGYHTRVEYDADSQTLHGKVEGIRDFVNFEASDIADLEFEFHSAVDDYLEFCAEVGKEPDKEYKGSFNVRIPPAMHRELAISASKNDISLNQAVETAIDQYLHPIPHNATMIITMPQNESKTLAPYSLPFNKLNWPSDILFPISAKG